MKHEVSRGFVLPPSPFGEHAEAVGAMLGDLRRKCLKRQQRIDQQQEDEMMRRAEALRQRRLAEWRTERQRRLWQT